MPTQATLKRAVLGAALAFGLACGDRAAESAPLETEFSTNFDLEDVESALLRVSRLLEAGFDSSAAVQLAERIASQPLDSEDAYHYKVRFAGTERSLRIEAFMDDVDAPDLYFYGDSSLTAAIAQSLEAERDSVPAG